MAGKKIGNLSQVLNGESQLNKFIMMGLFDKTINIGGSGELTDDFLVTIRKEVNMVIMKSLDDGRFSIQLAIKNKNKNKNKDKDKNKNKDMQDSNGNKVGFMRTVHTFVIDYKQIGFPVYNSEY